jgi:long-chain-fatty-acid---luciferin-component ligase
MATTSTARTAPAGRPFATSLDWNVDAVLGNLATVFRLPKPQQDVLKVELVQESFALHYEANPSFRWQCDQSCITPTDLHGVADLGRVPLIPVETFKRPQARALLSVPLDAIDLEVQSTGTGGIPSVARRDAATTTRACLALVALYREFFGIAGGAGLFLCPSPAETPEMGMVKVFNLFSGLLDDRAYLVRNFTFDPAEAVQYLRTWAGRQTRHLFGPPFMITRLLGYLEEKGLRLPLDPGSLSVTLGGWKRFNRERIGRREFDRKLLEYLGIAAGNSRDMYGMIESNLLAVECEHHHKHVPPWCHITVRDLRDPTLEVPAGRIGALGILDTLNTSYPGFLLSQDVGKIHVETECPCGRTGQVVCCVGRLGGAEPGCCALTIERFMAGKEACHA